MPHVLEDRDGSLQEEPGAPGAGCGQEAAATAVMCCCWSSSGAILGEVLRCYAVTSFPPPTHPF